MERSGDPHGTDRNSAGQGSGQSAGPRLDNLPSQPRLTTRQAAAHSVFIRRLRIALPVLGAVLVVIFLANAGQDKDDDFFLNDFADVDTRSEEFIMSDPHFSGVDVDGVPFDITADAAIQKHSDEKSVSLENPRAITGYDDERSVLSANSGNFNSDSKILTLKQNVIFEHSLGKDRYVLRTPDATFLIDDETITSTAGVSGEGPRGATLRADRMFADNNARKVIFEGNVQTRIYPNLERPNCKADNRGSADLGDCPDPTRSPQEQE